MLIVLLLSGVALSQESQPFDVVIEGGRIVDGTGNPWYVADLGIRGGVIASIGDLSRSARKHTIPAKRKVVAPGFIDMLVGSSIPLLLDAESADSKLLQGVTTIHVGEGDSMAPQNEQTLSDFPATDHLPVWHTFSEYSQLLARAGIPVNVVHNVGAAQVRRIVLGDADIKPSAHQLGR